MTAPLRPASRRAARWSLVVLVTVLALGSCGSAGSGSQAAAGDASPRATSSKRPTTKPTRRPTKTRTTSTRPPHRSTRTSHSASSTSDGPTSEPTADNTVLLGVSFSRGPGFAGVDFGPVPVAGRSSRTVAVRNAYPEPFHELTVSLSGRGFVLARDDCSGVDLAPQEVCLVTVRFTARDEQMRTGTLDVDPSDGPGGGITLVANATADFLLSGTLPAQGVASPPDQQLTT